MDMNRKLPKPGCDLDLWLSETINDAIRDATEAGLKRRTAAQIALSHGASCARTACLLDRDIEAMVGLVKLRCGLHGWRQGRPDLPCPWPRCPNGVPFAMLRVQRHTSPMLSMSMFEEDGPLPDPEPIFVNIRRVEIRDPKNDRVTYDWETFK
jgi:hypothetical protein